MGIKRPARPTIERAIQAINPAELDPVGRMTAERHAEAIRAKWAEQKLSVVVEIVYVPGPTGYRGGWSAKIVTPVAVRG